MDFLLTLDDRHHNADSASPLPSPPMPLPPALPGSPTIPPSGTVTPAPTVPPSPTLGADFDDTPPVLQLPSPPTPLTPHATTPLSVTTASSYFCTELSTPLEDYAYTQRQPVSSAPYSSFQTNSRSWTRGFEHSETCQLASSSTTALAPQTKSAFAASGGPVEVASWTLPTGGDKARPHNKTAPQSRNSHHSSLSEPQGDLDPSNAATWHPHPRHAPMPSMSSGGSNVRSLHSESSKRNAMFTNVVSPIDDFGSWIAYLNGQQPNSHLTPAKELTVDTRIATRRASDAGLTEASATGRRLSLSGATTSEAYIRDWRRDIDSLDGDNKPLPPQVPPPKRPLPLLPEPSSGTASDSDSIHTPLRRPSQRRPSVLPRTPESRSVGGGETTDSARNTPKRSTRSRPDIAVHPFAAHPFATATTGPSPTPRARRAGSINSLGSPGSLLAHSPSAPSFSSTSTERNAAQGLSSCSPTSYLGNNRQPLQYQQATWNFAQRSPETPTTKYSAQHLAPQPHHLPVAAPNNHPHKDTSKRRFASVTFRTTHGGDHHQDLELKKTSRAERRSSSYLDSKSDFGIGEGRAKTFMRKIAAWAR